MKTRTIRTRAMLLLGAAILFVFWVLSHIQTRAAQPLAEISACGSIITNTLWTSDNLYLATDCSIIIESGATLTIQPGTTIKFLGNQAVLIVRGTLNAQGSPAQPITFSSINDDQHGQTAAASTGSPAAEDWYGIYFVPGSSSQISYAFIGYGTAYSAPPIVGWNKAQLYAQDAALTLTDVEIAHGTRPGIYLAGNSDSVSLSNLYIHHHRGATSYPYATAIYQSNLNTQPTYQNITFTNNDRDQITLEVGNALTQDITLFGEAYGFLCGYSSCILTIPSGLTLTVAPGAQLDFRTSYGIQISAGGSLWAEGTPVSPITFTSQLAAIGENQYWGGIWAQPGSALTLSHCDITYAYGRNAPAALEIEADGAQVSECHIHHNSANGVAVQNTSGAPITVNLTNIRSTHNARFGAYLWASGGSLIQLNWNGGELAHNGWSGMWSYTNTSSIYPHLSNLTISQNGATGNFDERRGGLYFNYPATFATLENLTFTENAGKALYWTCSRGALTAHNLSATGNGEDMLHIPACTVSTGSQWNFAQVGIPVRIMGNVYVVNGGLLTIEPGSTLHFDRPDDVTPIGLYVQSGGALYALGTATQPITFTGYLTQTGWWSGIDFYNPAAAVLQYTHIAYAGGGNTYAALNVSSVDENTPALRLENSQIDHSAKKAVQFGALGVSQAHPPIVRGNHLHHNTEGGIFNWDANRLDARQNYWGDPTGPYHAAQNPAGLGQAVGDNILFYPWLTEPGSGTPIPGEMLLTTGAPPAISPGQTTEYTLQYLNLMTETVQNAVLMLQLPRGVEYLDSTSGGIYWDVNHQVFWKLGDIPAGAQNFLTVRVRFNWGLPSDYRAGSIAFLVGENYNTDAFDRTPYLEYQPVTVTQITPMTQAEFDALRIANEDLQTLYQQTLNEGYTYLESGSVTYSNGQVVQGAALRTANRQYVRLLTWFDGQALATTTGGGVFTLHNTTGGMTENLQTHARTFWGDWIPPEGGAHAPNTCTTTKCKLHCIGKSLSIDVVGGAVSKTFFWTISTGGTGGLLSGGYQVYKITRMVLDCRNACNTNPYSGCCDAEGQVRWSQGVLPGYCGKAYCNTTTGTWGTPGQLRCEGRCVALLESQGGGCKNCDETRVLFSRVETRVTPCAQSRGGSCSDTGLVVARDPNAIYGPIGDLLPGDLVTYTITYENEGEGRAYGVYVASTLPEVFNASSLTFVHGGGSYLPESREILWWVGELAPNGEPGAKGVITYTVQLTNSLPYGTLVANSAVVYFTSVPEQTPTNLWLNRVASLVAESQRVQTNYTAPVSVTLEGRDVSGLPLTFEVAELPRAGILSGTAPNLTYTPFENFSGYDGFTFKVSNGITESYPADVWVTVLPNGDVQPPLLMWSDPADGAVDVPISAAPLLTDTLGALYAPVLTVGFSEALSETTVTTASINLQADGVFVVTWLYLREDRRQIAVYPRTPLLPGKTYSLALSATLKDLAGNPLVPVTLTFTTAVPQSLGGKIYLPLVMR